MVWENIYSDLASTELGDHTGYVELFTRDDTPGKYHWEILRDAKVVTMGSCATPDLAKTAVEYRLALFES